MQLDIKTNNGFIISNNLHKVECDLKTNSAIIFKNGEVSEYCKISFRDHWSVSNVVQIINIVTNQVLFEVDLKGDNVDDWINQLLQAFADYLNDSDVIIGYYNIDSVKIVKVL